MASKPMLSFARIVSGADPGESGQSPAATSASSAIAKPPSSQTPAQDTIQSHGGADKKDNRIIADSKQPPPAPTHHYSRRNKPPRHRNDRNEKRHKDEALAVEKEESEAVTVQKEVVLEPAPLPAVNAWFSRQSSKRSTENGEPQAQQQTAIAQNPESKVAADPRPQTKDTESSTETKKGKVEVVTDAVSTEQVKKPLPAPTVASVVTGQPAPMSRQSAMEEVRQVDEKAWPSLNAALTEEQKADGTTQCGAAVKTHNVGKGAKTWKKLDIDVDYTGREGQSRRGNVSSSNRGEQNHSLQRNRRGGGSGKQSLKDSVGTPVGNANVDGGVRGAANGTAPGLMGGPPSLMGCPQIPPEALMAVPSNVDATPNNEYVEENYW
ncbi:hypothetical protein Tcan_17035 [Toxocara canis]|uniref:Uncharacterized protein n=1 Tax=Toxocara canis TaxID=6265 RepID=A0A0B2VFY3_TOXCA|nr:hypothetical protein Tcan_17035 [Toxocara canis]